MFKSHYFKCAVFLLLFVTSHFVVASTVVESEEIINTYFLEIDAEESYFSVKKIGAGEGDEYAKYSISGRTNIFDRHVETEEYILDESKITSIAIDSVFKNIDLSTSDFWDDSYILNYVLVDKEPINWSCDCFYLDSISTTQMNGEFDGEVLSLNGSGLFDQDTSDGVFRLDYSGDASYQITYHIEANVISAVPVPAAFYLFFSGIIGLVVTRFRG